MSNKEKALEYALRVDEGFLHLLDKAREIEAYLNEDVYDNPYEALENIRKQDEQHVNRLFSSKNVGYPLNDLVYLLANGYQLKRTNWPPCMVLKVINGDLVTHVKSRNSSNCTSSIIKINDLLADDWVVVETDIGSIGSAKLS